MDKDSRWLTGLEDLRSLFDNGENARLDIYSGIVFSRTRTEDELRSIFSDLEPAFSGEKLIRSISIPIGGDSTLLYLFFGRDNQSLERFNRCLTNLPALLSSAPLDLLPKLTIPELPNQADTALVTWTSLVYSTAWKYGDKILKAHLEFQQNINNFTAELWDDLTMPFRCDPRIWMTLASQRESDLRLADAEFRAVKRDWPEVIDAYLIEDLCYSSSAAIEVLSAASDRTTTASERTSQETPRSQKTASSKPREMGKRASKIEDDAALLFGFLIAYHSRAGKKEPLTQTEIAEKMNWTQARVSRRMNEAFPGGMEDYKTALVSGNLRKGYVERFPNGHSLVDGIVKDFRDDD